MSLTHFATFFSQSIHAVVILFIFFWTIEVSLIGVDLFNFYVDSFSKEWIFIVGINKLLLCEFNNTDLWWPSFLSSILVEDTVNFWFHVLTLFRLYYRITITFNQFILSATESYSKIIFLNSVIMINLK